MSDLISGKEALIALANGQDIEYMDTSDNFGWSNALGLSTSLFFLDRFKFRLKPHTIRLSLEIPAPFEPKEGEKAYRLAPAIPCGYTEFYFGEDENEWQFGAWRTEEQIKQVVAALRQVFGVCDD